MDAKVKVANLCERISAEIPDDLRFVPKQYLSSWREGGFVVRHSARDAWEYVQQTVSDESRVGAFLASPMGVGKSAIMYYTVHKARQNGWLVVYIPRCDQWIKNGFPNQVG